jgi:hypothetical protein
LLKGGAATGNIFTLPPGFRIGTQQLHGVPCTNGIARLDIFPGGAVQAVAGLVGSVDYTFYSIANISFVAEN